VIASINAYVVCERKVEVLSVTKDTALLINASLLREGGSHFCAIGTAHRVTPNPTATVLCHGLIKSEKQRFFKFATTGTHCLYLKREATLRDSQLLRAAILRRPDARRTRRK